MTMSRRRSVPFAKTSRLAFALSLGAVTCATFSLTPVSRALAQDLPERATEAASDRLKVFREEVIRLVNAERAKRGLAALRISTILSASAQEHARDMAGNEYFDHTSLDGRSPFDRILAAGYKGSAMGENIAAGRTTAREVMKDWMESEGHRANILGPQFREIGVGYTFDETSQFGHYWVQNYGSGTR